MKLKFTMNKIEKQLIDILETIEGNGSFVTSGQKKLIVPGMNIDGIGEVGFPLNQIQIDALIKTAHKAPFGKGSQTITDSTVRSAWEIDAEKISFHNEDWEKFIQDVLKKVKKGLGIGKKEVSAELYKLLIYEEGDFFLAHKDSEKQKGMFASLVIGLPSKHSGAELIIRFDGMEEIVDFSTAADSYKIQFAAFYADCEHEIRPVTSGHRVTLVYNLLQSSESADLSSPQFSSQVNEMVVLLDGLESSFADEPKAVLLGHQYTPANFSQGQLKHHDQPRAEALLEAVDKAGYMARLALVTCYQSGDLEGVGYGYDYHDYDISNATMGEIYEQYTQIEYWSDDDLPTLGNISLDEEGIITQMEIGDGDPIAEEADTYTGNAHWHQP